MSSSLPFLGSTLHDEHGGMRWLVERHLPTLMTQVSAVHISATPQTSTALIKLLRKHGCVVYQPTQESFAAAYKRILTFANRFSKNQAVITCDLDRVLHWMESHPKEWQRTLRRLSAQDYLIFERTSRAYRTHHDALYDTEAFVNTVTSRALGEKQTRDYLTGAMSFSAQTFKKLRTLLAKLHGDIRILCEIPLLLQSHGIQAGYQKCEGLEWETPDRFQEAVAAAGGLETWRTNASSPKEWQHRARMALRLCEPALKTIASRMKTSRSPRSR